MTHPILGHALSVLKGIEAECGVPETVAECRRLDDLEAGKVQRRGLRFSPLWTRPSRDPGEWED